MRSEPSLGQPFWGRQETRQAVAELVETEPLYPLATLVKVDDLFSFAPLP